MSRDEVTHLLKHIKPSVVHTPIIPVLRKQIQEDLKFKGSLRDILSPPHLRNKTKLTK